MTTRQPQGLATVAQLGEFDEVIDVRSPAEYADDHIPGAISCPVLDNDERIRVGTLYKQVSPFEARKIGAVLVARNIAAHVERLFLERPRDWRPLVYCWRGGQRSGAFTHILRQIGWDGQRLDGGYKSWRQHCVSRLLELPGQFHFRVICGATGSGKSRLLEALARQGAQTLHLEELAAHKGSVLGCLPDAPQPSQKAFETRLVLALSALDRQRPVFIEAESRRIGSLQLSDAMLEAMRRGSCLRVDATLPARVDFLLGDYDYFLRDPRWLIENLDRLKGLQSNETLARWHMLIETGAWPTLVGELLELHYDPHYRRSQRENYSGFATPDQVFAAADLTSKGIADLAEGILSQG
jgi:tRNA 2-selenouridine synthase